MDEAMVGSGGDIGAAPPQAGQGQDEVETLLASLESGQAPQQGPPQGVPDSAIMGHPAVQQMAARLQETQNQQGDAEIARGLLAGGLPQEHVPQVLQLFGVIRQLKGERDQAVGVLERLDQSEILIRGKAEELEKKFGKYGVKAEDLIRVKPKSAEAMEALATGLALVGRRNKVHERASSGADSFESARGQSGVSRADYLDMGKDGLDVIRRGIRG